MRCLGIQATTGVVPVGTVFGLYDEAGILRERPAMDVETGRFLEPLTVPKGWTLMMGLPQGGSLIPVLVGPC